MSDGVAGAVVLGGDYQGLGIVRSLGRRGIPVCVVDDERSIARRSRFATHALRVPDLSREEAIVDALLAAGRRFSLEGWVLFPTRDEIVNAISRNRDVLSEHFRVPTPAWDCVRRSADKRELYTVARELGMDVPGTAWPEDDAAVDRLDVRFPAVIKPAAKDNFLRVTGVKAWRVDDREQLRLRYRQARDVVPEGEVMVQEYVAGAGDLQYAWCGLFKDGGALASMTVRRRRQHPWEFGRASTYVETVPDCGLAEQSTRLLASIGYYGLAELEYKLDEASGTFMLLDFNARTWGYHTLGGAAGVDFPALLYLDQIGEPVAAAEAQPGVSWLRLLTDLPTSVLDIRAGRLSLTAYLESLRGADTEAVWDRHDPKPWLAELALLPYLMVRRGF